MTKFVLWGIFLVLALIQAMCPRLASAAEKPNVILIMADDMGYGDVKALNPSSKIPTPNLDRLASEGMTFLEAHSPSAVCTPTRYGLLTGRYCWRSQLKRGVLGGYSPPLVPKDRATVATVLKQAGYHTAAIGKWHLGMGLPIKQDAKNKTSRWAGDPGVDFTKPIADGPTTRGFDTYFGVSASLDMPPYVYIENDRFASVPTIEQPRVPFPAFVRAGPRSEDFEFADVLDRLTERAVGHIAKRSESDDPFFLYFALPAPHKPALPHPRFRSKTGLGPYGDFIHQVDWTVGQVLSALDKNQLSDRTLVIFTSDNGSYMYRFDNPDQPDHVNDETIQGYRAGRHRANGPFRGTKADIWEAGHHVPFFVRWPSIVEAGSECEEPICHVDVFATCAEIAGRPIGENAAEDSVSLLAMFRGKEQNRGTPVIHHSAAGMFAIREGRWKLVLGNGSGGRQNPKGKPFGKPYHLFDLSKDRAETKNLAEESPQVVGRLVEKFREIAGTDLLKADLKKLKK